MSKQMKNFFLLLCFLLPLTYCTQNPFAKKEKRTTPNGDDYFNFCFLGAIVQGISKEISIVDNQDGTISLAEFDIFGSSLCGTRRRLNQKTLIRNKKCIHGQVYRRAENDCKGTGTASNFFGATKVQFCSTNGGCTKETSIPFTLCKVDNSNPASSFFGDFTGSDNNLFYNYFKNRTEEIPQSNTDFFWLNGLDLFSFYDLKISFRSSQTEFHYILCSK
jgi:hypothetical protein